MIPSLFAFLFRRRLMKLFFFMAFSFFLGALAAWMYMPERLSDLRYLRGEMPELFTLLGIEGESSLGIHLMGMLYGFILPVFMILYQVSAGGRLLIKPLKDGRMAMLLAAKHLRSAVLLTIYLNLLVETALVLLACFMGQISLALLLFQGFSVPALLRLCLGFFLVMLPYGAFTVLIAVRAKTPLGMRRNCQAAMLATLIFTLAARLPGWTRSLRFLSPLTLFRGTELASGSGGWQTALWALPLAALFLLAALWSFSRREI
jgi:hypothetical protein